MNPTATTTTAAEARLDALLAAFEDIKGGAADPSAELEVIAQLALDVETLETRHSDRHDFFETAVWCAEQAMQAAYAAGLEAGRRQ